MTERQKEIRRRISLVPYLKELAILAGRTIDEAELVSMEQTEAFRDKIQGHAKTPSSCISLAFDLKTGEVFSSFVNQLYRLNPTSVYVWTPRSNDCGLLELASILEINFDFPFDIYPEGILEIDASDGNDRMLLDFSEDDSGKRWLEIEISGRNWGRAETPPQ